MNQNPNATSDEDGPEALRERIVDVLKTVYDPEIPIDIYEMGLIYRVAVKPANDQNAYPVDLVMTLTSPMCPVAETLPPEVEEKVRSVEGVGEVHLDLVWDPPWTPDMMSEAAKLALNM
jgi:FeS assembly SUF system protein